MVLEGGHRDPPAWDQVTTPGEVQFVPAAGAGDVEPITRSVPLGGYVRPEAVLTHDVVARQDETYLLFLSGQLVRAGGLARDAPDGDIYHADRAAHSRLRHGLRVLQVLSHRAPEAGILSGDMLLLAWGSFGGCLLHGALSRAARGRDSSGCRVLTRHGDCELTDAHKNDFLSSECCVTY